jgi:hypothetical protein
MTSWLLLFLTLAPSAPQTATSNAPAPIADNSFLIEEAYNQEPRVVQHISVFSRQFRSGDWAYSFTQEWPLDKLPRHQFSYTVSALNGNPSAGIGDTWLNWRYQLKSTPQLAIAPRASVILPTGSEESGRGAGSAGLDFNLPVSVDTGRGLVFHSNAGVMVVPKAHAINGDVGATSAIHLGQSVIWQTRPRFNAMLEGVYTASQALVASGKREWSHSLILSPGVRWGHDFKSGLQIVPGIAVPIELTDTSSSHWSILGYVSFEHPFGSKR